MKKILRALCHVRRRSGEISPLLWWMSCALCLLSCFTVQGYAYNKELDLAVKLMLEQKYYEALDECSRAERAVSGYEKSELYFVKGQCLMNLDNYSDAREVFKKAVSDAKGQLWIKIYIGIADSFFMERRYDDAISVYTQLLEKMTLILKL